MKAYMLGRKAGMTQLFGEDGKAVPVTVIECGPIKVVQRRASKLTVTQLLSLVLAKLTLTKLTSQTRASSQRSMLNL